MQYIWLKYWQWQNSVAVHSADLQMESRLIHMSACDPRALTSFLFSLSGVQRCPSMGVLLEWWMERFFHLTECKIGQFRDVLPSQSLDIVLNFFTTTSSTTFTQCAPEATEFGEITQNKGHYTVQGQSRSPILVSIESSCTISYYD